MFKNYSKFVFQNIEVSYIMLDNKDDTTVYYEMRSNLTDKSVLSSLEVSSLESIFGYHDGKRMNRDGRKSEMSCELEQKAKGNLKT